MRLRIETEARSLEAAWWDLWRRDPHATPFQSPAWLLSWRSCFPDGESVVVTGWRDGRLALLLPLFRLDGRLLLWGAGPSDWLDGCFEPGVTPHEAVRAAAEAGELLDLFQLQASSPLLRGAVPSGWRDECGGGEGCAVLGLPGRASAGMRQNLRYCRRRAERAGVAAQRGGAGALDALATLHTRRWQERAEPGIFADPRMLAWLRMALPALEREGLLRLHLLRQGAQTVAALAVLAAKGRAFYYIGGFEPGLAPLGLGTVLVGEAIAAAEAAGDRSFDFLRGREAYKYRWGAIDQPSHARRLFPPGAEIVA